MAAAKPRWLDGGKRWLCLYFPALAIDHWQRQQAEPPALGLYEGQQLVLCCPQARAAGIAAGMTLASARALLPSITLRAHEPEQAQALLQSLAQWAYGFTPLVMPEPPRRLLLEISGSERLFRGLPALLARIEAELQAWGCTVALGVAPTAAAARVLAQAQSEAGEPSLAQQIDALTQARWGEWVAVQPLARLGLPKAQVQRLARAGFTTVKPLLAVPLASLGRRFDKALVQLLQQLQGALPELAPTFAPAPDFDRSYAFMYGLTNAAHLQRPMVQLLAELRQFLQQRQLIARTLCWRFVDVHRAVHKLPVSVQRAHADTDEFLRLSQLKLEAFDAAAPIEVVALQALDLTAAAPVAASLFRELRDRGDDMARLIDRLYQRLSPDQLLSYQLCDEHLPELQQRAMRAGARPAQVAPVGAPSALLSPWLYPAPEPLRARGDALLWRGEPLELVSLAERIDSHWWAQRERRDYFIARVGCRYLRVFFCHRRRQWFGAGCYVC